MRVLTFAALLPLILSCSGPDLAVGVDPAGGEGSAEAAAPAFEPLFEEALLGLRIRGALLEHLRTTALRIHIEVVGGTVVLSGTVQEREERALAEEVALSVRGVANVDNQIALQASTDGVRSPDASGVEAAERELRDSVLEVRVQTRLVRELGETGFRIEVEATDGVVSLRGAIPDGDRKRLALDSARRVSGVRKVHDLLKIEE